MSVAGFMLWRLTQRCGGASAGKTKGFRVSDHFKAFWGRLLRGVEAHRAGGEDEGGDQNERADGDVEAGDVGGFLEQHGEDAEGDLRGEESEEQPRKGGEALAAVLANCRDG